MATEQSILAVIRAARPSFRGPHDKVAFAIHAAFLSEGYILNATGEAALGDDALSSAATDEVGVENWNEVEDNYAFVYSKSENGSKKILVKCLALKNKLLVDALPEGGSKPLHLEIDVGDYVEDNVGTNYGSHYKNFGKLVADVRKQILDKLHESPASSSSTQPSSKVTEPRYGYVNPEEPSSPPSGYIAPPIPGFGGSDLFPGPGAGMYPSSGNFGGGSMLVGPQDPRFYGGRIGDRGFPGGQPPPGARFDPYGPPDVPGFEPNRFARDPRRPGRGTHPDLHHFHDGSDFI